MTDFATVADAVEFVRDILPGIARTLQDGDLPKDIHAYEDPLDGAFVFGTEPCSRFEPDIVGHLSAAALRRSTIVDCVTVARRRRRARSIGRYHSTAHQPAWSCNTSILTLAMLRMGGMGDDVLRLLGPGRMVPSSPTGIISPSELKILVSARGKVSIDSHRIADGRIGVHASGTGPHAITTRDGHEVAIMVKGMTVPDTMAHAVPGTTLSEVLDHPICDMIPDMPVLRIENSNDPSTPYVKIHLPDRRMPIARPPEDADLSFVELGSDLLVSVQSERHDGLVFTPVELLPYDASMHLAKP